MGFLSIVTMVAVVGMAARIAQKAGFSGWWGVTQIVPLAGVVMIWVLAFVDWPGRLPPPRGRERDQITSARD